MFYLASGISILVLYRAYSESRILHLASCIFLQAHFSRQLGTSQPCISHVISHNLHFFKCTSHIFYSILLHFLFLISYFLCTYQCKSRERGSAGKGQGFDALDYPPVGLLIVWSDPGVGTFDFDWQKPGINSEAVSKSVPRGFLKVMLLEKGVNFHLF